MQLCACGDRVELGTTADGLATPLARPPMGHNGHQHMGPSAPATEALCVVPLGLLSSHRPPPPSSTRPPGPLQPPAGTSVLGILLPKISEEPPVQDRWGFGCPSLVLN